MKISELVKLKLAVEKYADVTVAIAAIDNVAQNLLAVDTSEGYQQHIGAIVDVLLSAKATLLSTSTLVSELTSSVTTQIDSSAPEYFNKNYYPEVFPDADGIRTNPSSWVIPSDEIKQVLVSRIQRYSDWHYPSMQLNPRDGAFTQYLVGGDPLYLVDVYHEFLASAASQYSEQYRNRLRLYSIGSAGLKTKDLSALPQGQFGFVFAWEMFNYLPIETVKIYLAEIFNVLRPGGTFMFSYNNGDTFLGAQNAEWGGMSFIPKRLLTAMCEGLGYVVTEAFTYEHTIQDISWLEIKKPGELRTCKAHQVLGIVQNVTK